MAHWGMPHLLPRTQQGSFYDVLENRFAAEFLEADVAYPSEPLTNYFTTLSPAGWAGCALPLVCIDCPGIVATPILESYSDSAHVCHLHEQYLSPGQSNYDSFKCLDGTCTSMQGRCNGISNCADGSDEVGCG